MNISSVIYAASDCLLAASEVEGFGLPLIEAAQRGVPILARDIPVFREVAGAHASYFSGNRADELALAVQGWLSLARQGAAPSSARPALADLATKYAGPAADPAARCR
jgi:glycosyltransferase involved in cell wall biosynthesis